MILWDRILRGEKFRTHRLRSYIISDTLRGAGRGESGREEERGGKKRRVGRDWRMTE